MGDTLIRVENVSKKFCRSLRHSLWYGLSDLGNDLLIKKSNADGRLRKKEFWASKDISFELKRGQCLGLIGRNGAGKSTLLKMLNGLIKPDEGRIEINGRVGALIALGAGFNPILSGRENIYVNAAVLGLKKKEIASKIDDIIEYAELNDFIDAPVQSYSSGMQVRLGFAVATALEPDILLLDEVLAVGDVGFRHKCHNRIMELTQRCAVIVVSHSIPNLTRISTDLLLLNKGRKLYYGKDIAGGINKYLNQFPKQGGTVIGSDIVRLHNCSVHGRKNGDDTIRYLDDLVIEMEVQFQNEQCADVLCLEIFDIESRFIAECFIDIPKKVFTSRKRVNITSIIPEIKLCAGRYALTVIFCKKIDGIPNGEFVAQYRSCVQFYVEGSGPISHAPFLLPGKLIW